MVMTMDGTMEHPQCSKLHPNVHHGTAMAGGIHFLAGGSVLPGGHAQLLQQGVCFEATKKLCGFREMEGLEVRKKRGTYQMLLTQV